MTNNKFKLLTAGLTSGALALGLSAAPAQASQLVTKWQAVSNVGFCTFVPPPPAVTPSIPGPITPPPPGCAAGTVAGALGTQISWGDPLSGGQSNIFVDRATMGIGGGMLNTNGVFVTTDTAGHDNFVITGDFLMSAEFIYNLKLTALAADDPAWIGEMVSTSLDFDVLFEETPNDGVGGTCPGFPGSEPGDFPGGCPDLFVLNTLNGIPIPATGDLEFPVFAFTKGSYDYLVTAKLIGDIGAAGPAICTELGAAAGASCVGFFTDENDSNDFDIQLKVDAVSNRSTPEPSSLGLLAAGIAGLGWLKKRKQAE